MTKPMMNALQQVQQAAKLLQQQGKSVNLALLRGRLAGQLTGPELFSAYQQWRNLPANLNNDELVVTDNEPPIANVQPESMELKLARIEAKLDHLLALLDKANVSG